ncbi:hypothetical protein [Streptomyces microflavus]|uniref:hypothetical protein n=1 Tax=Streptomyces microflavus TaxID=1919 RepID=UPI0033B19341
MSFRKIAQGASFISAAAAAVIMGAGPAAAATNWQEVNTNSNWYCETTKQHNPYSGVGFQGCVVQNSSGDAQVVLVVVNNGPKAVRIGGSISSGFGSNATCAASVLNPGFQRGCFAPTKSLKCNILYGAQVNVIINDTINSGTTMTANRPC